MSWQLPDRPLRASAATTKLAGLASVTAGSVAVRHTMALGVFYPVKASLSFAVFMAIAIGFLDPHHPFERFGPANQVTMLRAMLVALLIGLIGEAASPLGALSVAAGGVTLALLDGADGWIARTSRMASEFGARFDMEVDAIAILVLSVLAWRFDKAGWWILFAGLMRYGFVCAGWIAPQLRAALPPSRRRKAICVLQVVGLTSIMLPLLEPPVTTVMAAVMLAALSYSFLIDLVWLAGQSSVVSCQSSVISYESSVSRQSSVVSLRSTGN